MTIDRLIRSALSISALPPETGTTTSREVSFSSAAASSKERGFVEPKVPSGMPMVSVLPGEIPIILLPN